MCTYACVYMRVYARVCLCVDDVVGVMLVSKARVDERFPTSKDDYLQFFSRAKWLLSTLSEDTWRCIFFLAAARGWRLNLAASLSLSLYRAQSETRDVW